MKEIYLLTDYNGYFGSKWKSEPYRSGYDQKLISSYFEKYGYSAIFQKLASVDFGRDWMGKLVLFTSSEDVAGGYKQYIEDIIYGLSLKGAHCIPAFPYLRGHHNKVAMEILRQIKTDDKFQLHNTMYFGAFEEVEDALNHGRIEFPCVVKGSAGSMSRGVHLARNRNELIKAVKTISRSNNYLASLKDMVRKHKHPGYLKESKFQNKFILQPFIPNLSYDWKVLIYGDQYYVLKRHIKQNDFRASGSGLNYLIGKDSELPLHMLDFIEDFYNQLDVPHLSLDFAYSGGQGFIFEFQMVYFGTSTQYKCKDYFCKENSNWIIKTKEFDQEEAYVWGIVRYLEKHPEVIE